MRDLLQGSFDFIAEVPRQAEPRFGTLGPIPADEPAALVGQVLLGGEAMLLLGFGRRRWPVRSALRRVGLLLRGLEEPGVDHEVKLAGGRR